MLNCYASVVVVPDNGNVVGYFPEMGIGTVGGRNVNRVLHWHRWNAILLSFFSFQ